MPRHKQGSLVLDAIVLASSTPYCSDIFASARADRLVSEVGDVLRRS